MTRRILAAVLAALALTAAMCDDPASSDAVMVPSSFAGITTDIDIARGHDTEWVVAGSSRLVAQLADGAGATLLITADAATMQRAVDDVLVSHVPVTIATNRLVFAVAPGNPGGISSPADLADPSRLIGVCAAEVPCGRLATTAADALDLSPAADTEEPNVRSLALKIARGELDGGLVYATDAVEFSLDTVADDVFAPFVNEYQAAPVGGADRSGVLAFLRSDEGRAILAARGFGLP